LGEVWRALYWKLLIYFIALWKILWAFGILHDHSAHFLLIWYISSGFGIMYQEKSGNPALLSVFLTIRRLCEKWPDKVLMFYMEHQATHLAL
jgi:hypothetical protein